MPKYELYQTRISNFSTIVEADSLIEAIQSMPEDLSSWTLLDEFFESDQTPTELN